MPQMQAEFEYKCRRCEVVFVNMVQVLVGEDSPAAIRHLSEMTNDSQFGRRGPSLYAIHQCGGPETGIGDLIGYTIRPQVTREP